MIWAAGGRSIFKGYKPKKKRILQGWNKGQTHHYDSDLESFAKWCTAWHKKHILGIKTKPKRVVKKAVKKVQGRELYNDTAIIKMIKVGRQLSLADVREIRKNLRDELDRGVAMQDRIKPFMNLHRRGRDADNINDALLYSKTILKPDYWVRVAAKLKRN